MDFITADSGASLADSGASITDNKPLSKIEVCVNSMDNDFVVLEIKSSNRSQERIFWPRNKLEKPIQVGDNLMLELKSSESTSIQTLIENAKKNHHDNKNFGTMRKLLEELIN